MTVKVTVVANYSVYLEKEADRSVSLNSILADADQAAFDLVHAFSPRDSPTVETEEIRCTAATIKGML